MMTSPSGQGEESVTIRRSESADAPGIDDLITSSTREVFGRVNVIHLLEKANLAVTVADDQEEVVAHASFLDHPVEEVVEQEGWEEFLQEHFRAEECTPVNTLFLHLFVGRPSFTAAGGKELMRTVFSTLPELDFLVLIGAGAVGPGPALEDLFEPLPPRIPPGPPSSAFICPRGDICPKLKLRPARMEDLDDIMKLWAEQTGQESHPLVDPAFLQPEVLELQDGGRHTAVCESGGVVVGVVGVSCGVDTELLRDFNLGGVAGLDLGHAHTAAAPGPQEVGGVEGRGSQQEETTPPPLWDGSKALWVHVLLMDRKHQMRAVDVPPYLFTHHPDHHLCLLPVVPLSPDVPLFQSCIRAPPLMGVWPPPTDLYVLHRSVLSRVEVRRAAAADRSAVWNLMRRLGGGEWLQDLDRFYQHRRDPDGVPLQAFVVQVDGQVGGLLVLRDEQDLDFLRAHYHLENFLYLSHHPPQEHAELRLLLLEPHLQPHSRHVFKEVLRLARKSCLYHRGYPCHSPQNSSVHPLEALLRCAAPVRPRQQIDYPLAGLGPNAPPRRLLQEQAPFALSLITRKLTLEPKVAVNARIVVVGASDTGLSFLEGLCSSPHLSFNNLTLVSMQGFPGNSNPEEAEFLSTSHAYSSRDLLRLPLLLRITVVTGKMVAIDRKSKHVRVSGGGRVAYDHLILCTGLQYQCVLRNDDQSIGSIGDQVPRPTGVDPDQPGSCRQNTPRNPPSNMFTLNHPQDCSSAHSWLRHRVQELEGLVVYGSGLDVFTSVGALLGLGFHGGRIHLVLTPPQPGVTHFSDVAVETGVWAALEAAGVRVHQNCLLAQMNDGEDDPDPLTALWFWSGAGSGPGGSSPELMRLPCGVLLNLSSRGVDPDAFQSISRCFLAFDRRLVVDASFRTSDASIRAAPPLAEFSRRYHSDQLSATVSSKEGGQLLAAMMLRLLDPTQGPADESPSREDRLLPLYSQAKVKGGKLPGGLNYLHVSSPSANRSPQVDESGDRVLVTGGVETGDYFRLQVDDYQRVEQLTCVSLKPLPLSNYMRLYGKHQRLLGRLWDLYRQGGVHDLHSFFSQDCFLPVYLDRFCDLEEELQQITSQVRGGASADLHQDRGQEEETRAALRSGAVKYLSYNRNLLPMFATPGQL
ncbi:cilia- and flagella-associated protein 61 [Antennarius striatus]|uniref:cilia- and flagella-associated protein 61 n=1 Tax=Antennarius striatus TaxID=241820 RepID=UPI0035B4218A